MDIESILSQFIDEMPQGIVSTLMSVYEKIGPVVLLFFLGLVLYWIVSSVNKRRKLQYYKVKLFSGAEKNFLKILDRNLAGTYRIFGKPRIADVVMPKRCSHA